MTHQYRSLSRRALLKSAGLVAAGVGLGSRLSVARAESLPPISFQLSWVKSIQYGGYFAGIEQGYFRQSGVDPTFVSGGPNIDAVANVASGHAQIGDRPVGAIILGREKLMPLKVIATVFERSPYSIISLASKPITAISELKGKTIAVPVSSQPLVKYLLRDAGVDTSAVNIVPASPDPGALVSGQIDAYCGYSTNQGVMLQTRGVEIYTLNVQDLGVPETAGTLYASESFLEQNRDLVVRFLRAAIISWDWALVHPEETAHLMVDKYGIPGLDYTAQLNEIRASKPFIAAGVAQTKGLLSLDLDLYDRLIGIYRRVGMVKSDMTAAALCDPSFIEEAHRQT
jgi:ABC-type nitrate/sulfonate/bicarbonate transport system substrate-binding protein